MKQAIRLLISRFRVRFPGGSPPKSQRVYDNQGRIIWYDGVLAGNCPQCGHALGNVAEDIHRCTKYSRNIIFKHAMSGRKRYGGVPIQGVFCGDCGKMLSPYSVCQCPPPPTVLKANLPLYESPISFIRTTRLQLCHELAKGGGSHEDNGGCR